MKRALIFGGGVYGDKFPEIAPDDFVIAADAGCEILKKHGIEPYVTVGDFDSSGFIPQENAIVLPVEKDVTDTHAAVNIALQRGFKEIYIYGGMGGRPDHSFANFTLTAFLAEKGIKAFCIGEGYTVTAVKDGKIILHGKKGKTVSVFSWSERCEGVTLKGLKYPLNSAVLTNTFALGVSNSFESEQAEISVKNGLLLIMYEN
ncbi:MAG: thiamine diphosphokinase [Clostridia bacterium]|nr:thiamine diphosphokinase [Clostridia bacterium]